MYYSLFYIPPNSTTSNATGQETNNSTDSSTVEANTNVDTAGDSNTPPDNSQSSESSVLKNERDMVVGQGEAASESATEEVKASTSEQIELSTFQESSQPSSSVKTAVTYVEKDKLSSSTPCLSLTKATGLEEKPSAIQKATSSPVLPVTEVTKIDDSKGEITKMQCKESTECSNETQSENTPALPNADARTRDISSKIGQESGEISTAVGSEENTSSTIPPTKDSEESAAKTSDELIPSDENQESEGMQQEERKAFFYISSSELSPSKRRRPSSESSSLHREEKLEDHKCLGPISLHVGIILISISVAVLGLASYKLVHEGRLEKVYETAGLSAAALAGIVGVFSALYISFQMCFPEIPSIQYQMIGDVDTVTSVERTLYPEKCCRHDSSQEFQETDGTVAGTSCDGAQLREHQETRTGEALTESAHEQALSGTSKEETRTSRPELQRGELCSQGTETDTSFTSAACQTSAVPSGDSNDIKCTETVDAQKKE